MILAMGSVISLGNEYHNGSNLAFAFAPSTTSANETGGNSLPLPPKSQPLIANMTGDEENDLVTQEAPTTAPENVEVRVAIGEGSDATVQHYTYTPETVEINAGDSVTWVSPSELSDIHTVTFVLNPNVRSDIILPFAVSGSTNTELVPPFNLGDPTMIQSPDGRQAIVALNKQAWYPTVIDANNNTTYLKGTDIRYTMDGSEKLVNSGIILPQSALMAQGGDNGTSSSTAGEPTLGPPFPPISSFTVTFEQPGTYPYFCAIHPWMTGQVIVH